MNTDLSSMTSLDPDTAGLAAVGIGLGAVAFLIGKPIFRAVAKIAWLVAVMAIILFVFAGNKGLSGLL
jgi:hypothetical protein